MCCHYFHFIDGMIGPQRDSVAFLGLVNQNVAELLHHTAILLHCHSASPPLPVDISLSTGWAL
jgi:hypothetical protein